MSSKAWPEALDVVSCQDVEKVIALILFDSSFGMAQFLDSNFGVAQFLCA